MTEEENIEPESIKNARLGIVEKFGYHDCILYSKYEEYFKSINLPILEFRIKLDRYYCNQCTIPLEIVTSFEDVEYTISLLIAI
jgi:hypothetical protein